MPAMGFYYERWVRPVLFRLDPEKAHERAIDSLALLGAFPLSAGLWKVGFRAMGRHCGPSAHLE